MSERNHVLQMENITMQFGGVVAVNNLSLEVNEGEIVALIGPNGAGKTTAFNVITGVYQPTNGQVLFHDKAYVCNHPRGKMAKLYKGETPPCIRRTILWPLRRIILPRWALPVPFRISACGRACLCLTT